MNTGAERADTTDAAESQYLRGSTARLPSRGAPLPHGG